MNRFSDKISKLKEEWIPKISDKLLLWDFKKMKMREFVIGYSKEKAKLRRQEIDKLEREITLLENQLLAAPSKSIVDEINNKKNPS